MKGNLISRAILLMEGTEIPDMEETKEQVVEDVKKLNFKTAFEKIGEYFSKIWEVYKDDVWNFVGNIVIALIVYFVGRKLVKWISAFAERAFEKSRIDISVSKFLAKLISVLLNMVLFISIIGILNIPTTSLVALIGSAGLAVGLALQGSLANFAGGVMILVLKPFRVNDYIVASGCEGKVKAIDIFYTKLETPDNKKIVIPNGELSNASIQNVPNSAERRLDLIIPVEYSEDIKKVKAILIDMANEHKKIKNNKEISVFVDELAASSINIGFRVWVATADYWQVKWDLLESVIYKFREENINIPFDQLDVNLTQPITNEVN